MTLVIAHRGSSRAEPENTLAAFRRAAEHGADGVELDVRRTADDQLVVHHDQMLADGRLIRATPAAQLPDRVPALAEALDACDGMFVNVEIKNDPTERDFDGTEWVAHRTMIELTRRGLDARWLISSFRLETIDLCRRSLPRARTAWLVMRADERIVTTAAAHGHEAVNPWEETLDEAIVRRAHGLGLAVHAWTCDDPDRMRELMSWGVDGIFTNVPDVAVGVRASAFGRRSS